METTLAAVKVEARRAEVQEIDLPDVEENSAIMRVDAAGMCGAYGYFTREGRGGSPQPGMNAHENAGVIVKAGRGFLERHGVEEGELVALEEYLPCGHCEWCRKGEFRHCWMTDTHNNPQPNRLAGGFRQYLYLPANVVLHKVPQTMTADEAALALPVGNGRAVGLQGGRGGARQDDRGAGPRLEGPRARRWPPRSSARPSSSPGYRRTWRGSRRRGVSALTTRSTSRPTTSPPRSWTSRTGGERTR